MILNLFYIKWLKTCFKSETCLDFQSYLNSNADSAIIYFKKQIDNKSLDDYDVVILYLNH